MPTLVLKKKGGKGSGNWGHRGRPGLEGGSIPKGGNRVPLPGGGLSKPQPKGKPVPKKPKLTQSSRSGSIPKHQKGDKDGSKAYSAWLKANPDANEVDRSRMKSWFEDRAKVMEHNLSIATAVPGQRDEDRELTEEELKKKKAEEEAKKKAEEGKKKGKGKAKVKKKKTEPKAKKPPKAKLKKKPKVTDEDKARVLKTVGVSKADYDQFKKAYDLLKAGKKPDQATLDKMLKMGAISLAEDGNYKISSFSKRLMSAVEKGDALAAQEAMRKYLKSPEKFEHDVSQALKNPKVKKLIEDWEKVQATAGTTASDWGQRFEDLSKQFPVLKKLFASDGSKKSLRLVRAEKGGPGSGNWGHAGRPGKRGGSMPRSVVTSIVSGPDWEARRQAKLDALKKPKTSERREPITADWHREPIDEDFIEEGGLLPHLDDSITEEQYEQLAYALMNNNIPKGHLSGVTFSSSIPPNYKDEGDGYRYVSSFGAESKHKAAGVYFSDKQKIYIHPDKFGQEGLILHELGHHVMALRPSLGGSRSSAVSGGKGRQHYAYTRKLLTTLQTGTEGFEGLKYLTHMGLRRYSLTNVLELTADMYMTLYRSNVSDVIKNNLRGLLEQNDMDWFIEGIKELKRCTKTLILKSTSQE